MTPVALAHIQQPWVQHLASRVAIALLAPTSLALAWLPPWTVPSVTLACTQTRWGQTLLAPSVQLDHTPLFLAWPPLTAACCVALACTPLLWALLQWEAA